MIEHTPAFRPFTLDHVIALAWTGTLIAGSCWLGRRWLKRGEAMKERQFAAMWGGFLVGINAWSIAYWLAPARFDAGESLPLQLCDIAALTAPLVFLVPGWRLPRALMYFWGIGLSTQAFITPTVGQGPGDVRYWLFWFIHVAIVGSAVYDLVVRGFRPTRRDLVWTWCVTFVWVAAVFVLNIVMHRSGIAGANYGYVGETTPESPTVIDRLGQWPARAGVMVLLVTAIFVALWAVWRLPMLRKGAVEEAGGGVRG